MIDIQITGSMRCCLMEEVISFTFPCNLSSITYFNFYIISTERDTVSPDPNNVSLANLQGNLLNLLQSFAYPLCELPNP